MYKLIRPLIFRGEAELMHGLVRGVGETLSRTPAKTVCSRLFRYSHPALRTNVLGLEFANPVGLAASFARTVPMADFLTCLGFGFIEIATITPKPQEGNPKPRIFRLPEDEALINRLGFPNEGLESFEEQLHAHAIPTIVGMGIAKNKDTSNTDALKDYEQCFRGVADSVDFVVVNVSSPNTPQLRELQGREFLRNLLNRLGEIGQAPILLKIAPDLSDAQLDDIVAVVQETPAAGVVATNTTTSREGLKTAPLRIQAIGAGGLSGKPLADRSTQVIRYLFEKSGGAFPIIGVGGIFSAQDAYEKIRAGASLVQVYTGLIYEGPGIVKRINRGLVRLLERDGFSSVGAAVGTGFPQRRGRQPS